MGLCDALKDWDDLSPEERFDQMADWAQQWAQEWGMDPPNIENSDTPPEASDSGVSGPAGYDPATNTVYLGPDFFSDEAPYSATDVLGEAAHELRHAMQWQYYGEDTPYAVPSHGRGEEDARDFGDAVRDLAEDECDQDPESASEESDGEDGDWDLEDEWEEETEEEEEDHKRPKQPKQEDQDG